MLSSSLNSLKHGKDTKECFETPNLCDRFWQTRFFMSRHHPFWPECSRFGSLPYLCTPQTRVMKQDIHPENYRLVVFKDMSNDYAFLSKSTATSRETITWEDGNEYPLVKMEVSHKSHPFYTGKAQFVDTAGRIDKFRQKYGKFNKTESNS